MKADARQLLHITVVFSPAPRDVHEVLLTVSPGCTVVDALALLPPTWVLPSSPLVGVWGAKAESSQPLLDGDRVEIYRDLKVDPKVARRLRFAGQGAKTAGLFSQRRVGSKAGY